VNDPDALHRNTLLEVSRSRGADDDKSFQCARAVVE
jgi:hypothetical protein